jgi:hypothetical protein
MSETAILHRIKNRKIGFDPVLEDLSATKLTVTTSIVTKIETFKKDRTADSGIEQTVVKYFTERDAYLVTIKNWNSVKDKEAVLRRQIVPLLNDRLKLNPKLPVVFQFLDGNGKPMRHKPAPGPKVMAPGD